MARRRQTTAISLFPFLAVLVCTMGALILLLLVTTRQIRRDQQVEKFSPVLTAVDSEKQVPTEVPGLPIQANPDDTDAVADLDRQILQLHDRIMAIDSDLQHANQQFADRVAQRDAARERCRRVSSELETLSVNAATGTSQLHSLQEDVARLRQQEELLRVKVHAAEKELLRKQEQLAVLQSESTAKSLQLHEERSALLVLRRQLAVQTQQQRSRVDTSGTRTLLEFSNPTGTTRTPVVIDVSERGFEFLPTGMRVTPEDMEGFPSSDNPLVAAVLALHRHRSSNSIASEPYVLLLVRPTGCLPFYVAQRILSDSHIHFGYELLTPDRTIDVGLPVDTEVRIVRTALLEALNRRETLYAMLRREAQAVAPQARGDAAENRRLVIRPDGQVLAADDGGSGRLDGRFYAGGEVPRWQNAPPRRRSPMSDPLLRDGTDALPERRPRGIPDTGRPEPGGLSRGDVPAATRDMPESPLTLADQNFPEIPPHPLTVANPVPQTAGAPAITDSALTDSHGVPDWLEKSGVDRTPATRADEAHTAIHGGIDGGPAGSESAGRRSAATQDSASPQSPEMQWLSAAQSPGSGDTPGSAQSPNSAGSPGSVSTAAPESAADLSRLDPELARLLKSQSRPGRDQMTPVGVTVFLDPRHLTIGSQPAVYVTPETRDVALAALLQGISDEVAAARVHPREPLLPIVKFIVSPGAEQLRVPLARELQLLGIPSASVLELSPHILPTDDAGRARLDALPELPPVSSESASSTPRRGHLTTARAVHHSPATTD